MIKCDLRIVDIIRLNLHDMVDDIPALASAMLTQSAVDRLSLTDKSRTAYLPCSALIKSSRIILCHCLLHTEEWELNPRYLVLR